MRKLVYILIFIIGCVSIGCNSIGKGNKAKAKDSIEFYYDVLFYLKKSPDTTDFQYLFIKRGLRTYELYNEHSGSEIGSWVRKGDTLYMTPELSMYHPDSVKPSIVKLSGSLTPDSMNIQKKFLVKNLGIQLKDVTPCNVKDINPSYKNYISDEYFMVGPDLPKGYLKKIGKATKKVQKIG